MRALYPALILCLFATACVEPEDLPLDSQNSQNAPGTTEDLITSDPEGTTVGASSTTSGTSGQNASGSSNTMLPDPRPSTTGMTTVDPPAPSNVYSVREKMLLILGAPHGPHTFLTSRSVRAKDSCSYYTFEVTSLKASIADPSVAALEIVRGKLEDSFVLTPLASGRTTITVSATITGGGFGDSESFLPDSFMRDCLAKIGKVDAFSMEIVLDVEMPSKVAWEAREVVQLHRSLGTDKPYRVEAEFMTPSGKPLWKASNSWLARPWTMENMLAPLSQAPGIEREAEESSLLFPLDLPPGRHDYTSVYGDPLTLHLATAKEVASWDVAFTNPTRGRADTLDPAVPITHLFHDNLVLLYMSQMTSASGLPFATLDGRALTLASTTPEVCVTLDLLEPGASLESYHDPTWAPIRRVTRDYNLYAQSRFAARFKKPGTCKLSVTWPSDPVAKTFELTFAPSTP